jgi:3-deoxy-manno-octulosonate cytidylyltransferase (CMP-KDO synthetase)
MSAFLRPLPDWTDIATDDERACRQRLCARYDDARGPPSGTDRVAEVASAVSGNNCKHQGDEPLIDPAAIDAAILPMVHEPEINVAR